jgi:hypothetical protein
MGGLLLLSFSFFQPGHLKSPLLPSLPPSLLPSSQGYTCCLADSLPCLKEK